MSVGFIGSKHTVYDAYPVRNKRVFLLVDPQNCSSETTDFFSTMTTINYLLAKQASVIVAASFGGQMGASLNLSRRQHANSIEAFQLEKGMGYTNYFSSLPTPTKAKILQSIPSIASGHSDPNATEPSSGKTFIFAGLANAEKAAALRSFFPKKNFSPVTTAPFVSALRSSFPHAKVSFAPDCLRAPVNHVAPGDIMVLENLQFYRNETSTDPRERAAMAEVLAVGIDLFINDSFATAHCTYSSNTELPKLLQHGAAGHAMDRELAFYSKFLSHPARPLVVAVGGENVAEKLRLIHSLAGKVDRMLISGPVALPFLVAKGLTAGLGYCLDPEPTMMSADADAAAEVDERRGLMRGVKEVTYSKYASEILEVCERYGIDIVLPVDHMVVKDLRGVTSMATLVSSAAVPSDSFSVDCGTGTISLFSRCLRDCHTLFWVGAFGIADRGYVESTRLFASVLGSADIVSVVGGRYTARVVQEVGVAQQLLHVSSGGLSCLEVLQGNPLPGIEALTDVVPLTDSKASLSVNELIRHLPLFVGCSSHQMKVAAKKFVRRVHTKGDYLISRGDHHVRLWLVAQGGLVARHGPINSSAPARYITRGQTVGMYDFITQALSTETVRVAHDDTVTYHLSSSALNEFLNSHPDAAAQLLQNISTPLSLIANRDYCSQQTIRNTVVRNACYTRVPTLFSAPVASGFWEDIAQDVSSNLFLQKLTMCYTPYVALATFSALEDNALDPGVVGHAGFAMQRHRGLSFAMAVSVVRCTVYHICTNTTGIPWVAALVSTVASSPLRVLSYGISYRDMNFKLMLDEALIGAGVCMTPLLAYSGYLGLQRKVEALRNRRLGCVGKFAIMSLVKLLLGVVIFPIIYQRNFLYTQPAASRFWDAQAFHGYQVKQCASLLLRFVVNIVFKMATAR